MFYNKEILDSITWRFFFYKGKVRYVLPTVFNLGIILWLLSPAFIILR